MGAQGAYPPKTVASGPGREAMEPALRGAAYEVPMQPADAVAAAGQRAGWLSAVRRCGLQQTTPLHAGREGDAAPAPRARSPSTWRAPGG
jgi:hypothetical protein